MASKRPTHRSASSQPDLVLAETLDLREAAPLTAALLARQGRDVAADGSIVRRLGGQCLQVLLSAHASWQADGKSFRVLACSPELTHALEQFGAGALLTTPPRSSQ